MDHIKLAWRPKLEKVVVHVADSDVACTIRSRAHLSHPKQSNIFPPQFPSLQFSAFRVRRSLQDLLSLCLSFSLVISIRLNFNSMLSFFLSNLNLVLDLTGSFIFYIPIQLMLVCLPRKLMRYKEKRIKFLISFVMRRLFLVKCRNKNKKSNRLYSFISSSLGLYDWNSGVGSPNFSCGTFVTERGP